MAGRFLLDTNIIIAFMAGETSVQNLIAGADQVFLCSVVLGELYFGALKSERSEENLGHIERLADILGVLTIDRHTAREYGSIKNRLKEKGRPIPENDTWIAAIARQHDLTLVSRDEHFLEVDNLKRLLC